jgi:uncharacterized membrane protein YqiK
MGEADTIIVELSDSTIIHLYIIPVIAVIIFILLVVYFNKKNYGSKNKTR